MKRYSRPGLLLRVGFVWSVAALLAYLVSLPVAHLAGGGGAGLFVALAIAIVFGSSLIRGAFRTSRDLLSGEKKDHIGPTNSRRHSATRKRQGLLINTTVLATSGVITLFLLELVFRVFFPQPLYAVQFAPWGFWHIPNASFVHGAEARYEGKILRGTEFVTHVRYNSFGMRERELPLGKGQGVRRIVVLGDSYGEGLEVEFEQTVGQALERLLNESRRAVTTAVPRPRPQTERNNYADTPDWSATRPIFERLASEVTRDGATLLVANVHYGTEQWNLRTQFFESRGINWVDLSLTDPALERPLYHYRFDGHWKPMGHERAARLIRDAIVVQGLLSGSAERFEVLNASMSAFSTCKELWVYKEIARRFSPDLVVVIYTGADDRNLGDLDICRPTSQGVELHPRSYSQLQQIARSVRSLIRANSHFGTWVLERLITIPILNDLRFRLMQGEAPVRFIEEQR